MAATRERKKTG